MLTCEGIPEWKGGDIADRIRRAKPGMKKPDSTRLSQAQAGVCCRFPISISRHEPGFFTMKAPDGMSTGCAGFAERKVRIPIGILRVRQHIRRKEAAGWRRGWLWSESLWRNRIP